MDCYYLCCLIGCFLDLHSGLLYNLVFAALMLLGLCLLFCYLLRVIVR